MRCKQCDNVMLPAEIKWLPDLEIHEEFCSRCLAGQYTDEAEAEWDRTFNKVTYWGFEEDEDTSSL